MIKITMMQFRREPGEWIHQVYKHNETIIITKAGREVAQLCPLEDGFIDSKGKAHGAMPLTRKQNWTSALHY
jgi:prevent-host-death family protein